jgi:hypothetical protein
MTSAALHDASTVVFHDLSCLRPNHVTAVLPTAIVMGNQVLGEKRNSTLEVYEDCRFIRCDSVQSCKSMELSITRQATSCVATGQYPSSPHHPIPPLQDPS